MLARSLEHHWTAIETQTRSLRDRIAEFPTADEHVMRAEAACIMHAAANLFELEIRWKVERDLHPAA